jgi:lipoprotein-anchoring transpeptidase ErfK/SrfK
MSAKPVCAKSVRTKSVRGKAILAAMVGGVLGALTMGQAHAQSLFYGPQYQNYAPQQAWSQQGSSQQAWAPADTPFTQREALPQSEEVPEAQLPPQLQRQIVNYASREAPGTVVIDTPNTVLYYVLGNGRAIRYGVGVGRDGFTWAGVKNVSRKAEWPDWTPPPEMIARQPYLPRFVAGGPGNPLGARAMYLGGSAYRIHGTNDPTTIGKFVSSGCIRMTNDDVMDLYQRVGLGNKVVVLPMRSLPAVARAPQADVRTATRDFRNANAALY